MILPSCSMGHPVIYPVCPYTDGWLGAWGRVCELMATYVAKYVAKYVWIRAKSVSESDRREAAPLPLTSNRTSSHSNHSDPDRWMHSTDRKCGMVYYYG